MQPTAHWSKVEAVHQVMRGLPAPWCVAGGWAIDLFLGRPTRDHSDVDLVILRRDQGYLREHLRGWTFRKVVRGSFEPWAPGERLELPVHEIHAASGTGVGLEILLNEHAGDEWVFRRNPAVRYPIHQLVHTSTSGIPVLAPPVALLYKAKDPRPVDQQDFQMIEPALSEAQRSWLHDALASTHPDNPWLPSLAATRRRTRSADDMRPTSW